MSRHSSLYDAPPPPPPPLSPYPLQKTPPTCYGLYVISWAPRTNVVEYRLYRSVAAHFGAPGLIYAGPNTDFAINVPSGSWYLRARACNAYGCSGETNMVPVARHPVCNP